MMIYRIERKIVAGYLRAVARVGFRVLHVFDGDDRVKTRTRNDVMDAIFAVDEAWVVYQGGLWMRFVLGNGEDVLCDYGVSEGAWNDAIDGESVRLGLL